MSSQNKGETQTYAFSLSKANCYNHSQAIKLNFENSNYCPIFNHDKQHSTPAFLVAQEKVHTSKFRPTTKPTLPSYSSNLVKQSRDNLQNWQIPLMKNFCKCQIWLALVQIFAKYAKWNISSYFDHLENENHTKKVNNSLGQQYIIELTTNFQKQTLLPSFHTKKQKNIKKNKCKNKTNPTKPSYPSSHGRAIIF